MTNYQLTLSLSGIIAFFFHENFTGSTIVSGALSCWRTEPVYLERF